MGPPPARSARQTGPRLYLMVAEFFLGDELQLRKPHPCGNDLWMVVRLGADIGLRCQRCARQVLLPRSVLERRIKQYIRRGIGSPPDLQTDVQRNERNQAS